MAERELFKIGPEDIERSKSITGIRTLKETDTNPNPTPVPDFDIVSTMLTDEQPYLFLLHAFYSERVFSGKIARAIDQHNKGEEVTMGSGIVEPSLSVWESPMLAGMAFVHFAMPEDIRKKQMDIDEAMSIERQSEESYNAGEPVEKALGESIGEAFGEYRELGEVMLEIAEELDDEEAQFEFVAGGIVTLLRYVARDKAEILREKLGQEKEDPQEN
ncbi:MAG TPA: hypothetical protein VHE53_00140 [Patescibacteria group bacterium]|nr:hypothetical protein [Patescibacteria group bacterium]